MGADSPAEKTPNASKHFSPKCLPNPKSLFFFKKSSLWLSLVREQAAVQSQTGILEGHLGYILMSRIIVHVKFMFSEKGIKFKKDLQYFFDA